MIKYISKIHSIIKQLIIKYILHKNKIKDLLYKWIIILIQNKWDNKNKTNYIQIMFLNNILNRIIYWLMNKIINQLEINIENKRITRN